MKPLLMNWLVSLSARAACQDGNNTLLNTSVFSQNTAPENSTEKRRLSAKSVLDKIFLLCLC